MSTGKVAMSTVQVEMSSVQFAMSSVQVATSSVQVEMNTGQVATSSVQFAMSPVQVAMSTVTVETVHAKKMSPDLPKHFRIKPAVAGLAPIAATTKRMLCGWGVPMPCFFLFEIDCGAQGEASDPSNPNFAVSGFDSEIKKKINALVDRCWRMASSGTNNF